MTRPAYIRFFLLTFLAGCSPSAREMMDQTFSADPPVLAEYELDGSRLYKTRNIALDVRYAESRLSSLVMVMALPGHGPAPEAEQGSAGIMKFRSVAPEQRFQADRSLILSIGANTRDLGPCAYETDLLKGKDVVESLTAYVPLELMRQMAGADTVRGSLGQIPFQLAGLELSPLRALLDTVSH